MRRAKCIVCVVLACMATWTSQVEAQTTQPSEKTQTATTQPAKLVAAMKAAAVTRAEGGSAAHKAEVKAQSEGELPAVAKRNPESKPDKPDPMAEPVSLSFQNMSVDRIAPFLGEKLNKPVLVNDSIKSKRISIITRKKHTLAEALYLLRLAMLDQGVMVEELDTVIRIRPVSEILQAKLVRIPAEQDLNSLSDPLQIVAKEFLVRHFDVNKIVAVLQPMLTPNLGRMVADPDSSKLIVTDTVVNLRRLDKVMSAMDLPQAEPTITEIIKLKYGDATEVIGIIRWLIAGDMGTDVKEIMTVTAGGGNPGSPMRGPMRGPHPGMRGGRPTSRGPSGNTGNGVTKIEPCKTPVTLVPHVSRNWIIAVAPAKMMGKIKDWANQLDQARQAEEDYELYQVKYADVTSLARQITQVLHAMPNAELKETTNIVPFPESKKFAIFGSKSGRKLVKDMLAKLDVEDAEKNSRKTFILKYADAEEMAERIESLFSAMQVQYKSHYYTSYQRDSSGKNVKVVADKRRNTITVITDPQTMKEIEQLIEDEDIAVDPKQVKPRIYELKYVDPGEMQTLLSSMFSEKEDSDDSPWRWWYGGSSKKKIKPVGRLLGQFTFQVLASSNRLIVNSKSPANYRVIDELIADLDRPQHAGLPAVCELKYANAEDLCEQLNALLSEPSTQARIRRADRGLADYQSRRESQRNGQNSNGTVDQQKETKPDEMTFWWQGFKPPNDQVPTSNLIGKIRIVPVYRRNALMVLAPDGYKEPIVELIEQLDQPGRQVMIRARIGEVQHNDQTTLGLRIASDPSILAAGDTAIGGSASLDYSDAFFGGSLVVGGKANVTILLNLLIDKFKMKILLEPTITTSDNQASEFFDGQDVPVQDEARTSSEGTSTVTQIKYEEVGTRLRVRPHVTQNGNVDLMVNLEISRIVPGTSALGNFIFDRREVTTHIIVNNGQTIMLSGIIRQEDFDDVRKWPLLGDLPLIGKFFRSIDRGTRNRELVVFLTPYVMYDAKDAENHMKKPRETLKNIEEYLDAKVQKDSPDECGKEEKK